MFENYLASKDDLLAIEEGLKIVAFVFGKILLTQYPKTWPKLLTERPRILN